MSPNSPSAFPADPSQLTFPVIALQNSILNGLKTADLQTMIFDQLWTTAEKFNLMETRFPLWLSASRVRRVTQSTTLFESNLAVDGVSG